MKVVGYTEKGYMLDATKEEIANLIGFYSTYSEEYRKAKEKQTQITRENPKISKVLYDKDIEVLSEDELCLVLKVLDYEENMRMLEEKELFYRGGKEAFLFFIKSGIINK